MLCITGNEKHKKQYLKQIISYVHIVHNSTAKCVCWCGCVFMCTCVHAWQCISISCACLRRYQGLASDGWIQGWLIWPIKRTVPVGLCRTRKRKGLSTETQGGEDRASKMAVVAAAAFVPSSFTTILAFWSALDT